MAGLFGKGRAKLKQEILDVKDKKEQKLQKDITISEKNRMAEETPMVRKTADLNGIVTDNSYFEIEEKKYNITLRDGTDRLMSKRLIIDSVCYNIMINAPIFQRLVTTEIIFTKNPIPWHVSCNGKRTLVSEDILGKTFSDIVFLFLKEYIHVAIGHKINFEYESDMVMTEQRNAIIKLGKNILDNAIVLTGLLNNPYELGVQANMCEISKELRQEIDSFFKSCGCNPGLGYWKDELSLKHVSDIVKGDSKSFSDKRRKYNKNIDYTLFVKETGISRSTMTRNVGASRNYKTVSSSADSNTYSLNIQIPIEIFEDTNEHEPRSKMFEQTTDKKPQNENSNDEEESQDKDEQQESQKSDKDEDKSSLESDRKENSSEEDLGEENTEDKKPKSDKDNTEEFPQDLEKDKTNTQSESEESDDPNGDESEDNDSSDSNESEDNGSGTDNNESTDDDSSDNQKFEKNDSKKGKQPSKKDSEDKKSKNKDTPPDNKNKKQGNKGEKTSSKDQNGENTEKNFYDEDNGEDSADCPTEEMQKQLKSVFDDFDDEDYTEAIEFGEENSEKQRGKRSEKELKDIIDDIQDCLDKMTDNEFNESVSDILQEILDSLSDMDLTKLVSEMESEGIDLLESNEQEKLDYLSKKINETNNNLLKDIIPTEIRNKINELTGALKDSQQMKQKMENELQNLKEQMSNKDYASKEAYTEEENSDNWEVPIIKDLELKDFKPLNNNLEKSFEAGEETEQQKTEQPIVQVDGKNYIEGINSQNMTIEEDTEKEVIATVETTPYDFVDKQQYKDFLQDTMSYYETFGANETMSVGEYDTLRNEMILTSKNKLHSEMSGFSKRLEKNEYENLFTVASTWYEKAKKMIIACKPKQQSSYQRPNKKYISQNIILQSKSDSGNTFDINQLRIYIDSSGSMKASDMVVFKSIVQSSSKLFPKDVLAFEFNSKLSPLKVVNGRITEDPKSTGGTVIKCVLNSLKDMKPKDIKRTLVIVVSDGEFSWSDVEEFCKVYKTTKFLFIITSTLRSNYKSTCESFKTKISHKQAQVIEVDGVSEDSSIKWR